MGFDIVHFNLHKTFSQPHGGGGPAAGRWRCATSSSRTCRRRWSCATATNFRLDHDRPKSIGTRARVRGPFGVFVRSYAYIRSYGPGLREMSEIAVLNANYLLALLKDDYELPLRPALHARVRALGARPQARVRRHAPWTSPSG